MIDNSRSEWCVLLMLTGIWVSLVLLVDPRGNFPMLDDWSYAHSVKHLMEHGELHYDDWNAPTLFLQVLYGSLFCWPFGFSFEALRISALAAGLAGGLGTYLLLREVAASKVVAMMAALVLMLNRLRWQAVNGLVDEMKIDPAAIDGGLSVSGWYLFPTEGRLRRRYANSPSERRNWWRNDGAEYIVAITTPARLERMIAAAKRAPDDRLDVVWRKSFEGWLPGSGGDLLVCRGRLCADVFNKK